ncbi:MAG: xylulokinase [Henriciella sp.]
MFLGIDIGTSAVKSVVIDGSGDVVATGTAPLAVSRPRPNWSEQDPADWWAAVSASVCALPAETRRRSRAVGLTGQMHGATLLGADDQVLRPAMLWNDGRSGAECAALQAAEPAFLSRGGNLVMPGFTAPKLEWVRRHEPDIFAKTHKVLLPKDYVRLCMTGTYASDMSDAAGTLWMDVAQRQWAEPLLQACGLEPSHMPTLFEGPAVTGSLRPAVAEVWGLDPVPVVAGGSDNAAGALGAGATGDGDTILSLGTSGVIFTTLSTYRSNPASAVHAFCHALPDRWHLMSVMLSAASCLTWACRVTRTSSVGDLLQLAEQAYNPRAELIFLPYLSGERTPHNNADARGVFVGLTHETGPGDLANAVLEGVAFGLMDGFEALLETGVAVDALSVIGGGAMSAHWGRLLSATLRRPLLYREDGAVGPALGAARLARFGTGDADLAEAFTAPDCRAVVEPEADLTELLGERRLRFRTLYDKLRFTFEGTST